MACPGKPKAQRRFDRALASEPAATLPEAGGGQRHYRCFKKTIPALLSAATAAFRTPAGFKGKVNLVHIQSAALAGWGCNWLSSNFGSSEKMSPAAAVAVDVVGGILSIAGSRCESLSLHITSTNFRRSSFWTCLMIVLELTAVATDCLSTHGLEHWCSRLTLQILSSSEYCPHNAALIPP